MVAHCHAQIWNAAEPARSLGVAETTARRYLDLLAGVYMIRQLPPWHENLVRATVAEGRVEALFPERPRLRAVKERAASRRDG